MQLSPLLYHSLDISARMRPARHLQWQQTRDLVTRARGWAKAKQSPVVTAVQPAAVSLDAAAEQDTTDSNSFADSNNFYSSGGAAALRCLRTGWALITPPFGIVKTVCGSRCFRVLRAARATSIDSLLDSEISISGNVGDGQQVGIDPSCFEVAPPESLRPADVIDRDLRIIRIGGKLTNTVVHEYAHVHCTSAKYLICACN